jgi:hypothetical protein
MTHLTDCVDMQLALETSTSNGVPVFARLQYYARHVKTLRFWTDSRWDETATLGHTSKCISYLALLVQACLNEVDVCVLFPRISHLHLSLDIMIRPGWSNVVGELLRLSDVEIMTLHESDLTLASTAADMSLPDSLRASLKMRCTTLRDLRLHSLQEGSIDTSTLRTQGWNELLSDLVLNTNLLRTALMHVPLSRPALVYLSQLPLLEEIYGIIWVFVENNVNSELLSRLPSEYSFPRLKLLNVQERSGSVQTISDMLGADPNGHLWRCDLSAPHRARIQIGAFTSMIRLLSRHTSLQDVNLDFRLERNESMDVDHETITRSFLIPLAELRKLKKLRLVLAYPLDLTPSTIIDLTSAWAELQVWDIYCLKAGDEDRYSGNPIHQVFPLDLDSFLGILSQCPEVTRLPTIANCFQVPFAKAFPRLLNRVHPYGSSMTVDQVENPEAVARILSILLLRVTMFTVGSGVRMTREEEGLAEQLSKLVKLPT